MMDYQNIAQAVERDGCAIVPNALSDVVVNKFRVAAEKVLGSGVSGARNVFSELPEARTIAASPVVRALAEAVLGPSCFAVRAILFDKTPEANWVVPWHQDLTIAVKARHNVVGWGPWSEKVGVPHVQPPTALLSRMLAVRLHFDDCGTENGPLRVLPGTHRQGRLSGEAIRRAREAVEEQVCAVPSGGAILMRTLLLHASSPAIVPGRRRVLHLEWASEELPIPLDWYETVR